jgi:hypothetical protein
MVERNGESVESTSDDIVTLPYLVQDRLYLRPGTRPPADDVLLASPLGEVTLRGEGPYLDGPATARVAVVDTDAETGRVRPGARLQKRRGRRRSYELGVDLDADSPVEAFDSDAFIQVSAFATVMRTIMFFEGQDGVGRRIPWSCGPRLTVVPRAGLLTNAFYDRDSASLRFFSFPSPQGYPVHAALSHDVVCHETAHALLDGLAPDLYDAITAQSLAVHEAVADLAAIALTLLNEQVVFSLFNISGGLVDPAEALSRMAEEFGSNARAALDASYLRSATNDRTLDPADRSTDRAGMPNAVDRTDPHAVSEVFSGAVYSGFRGHFDELRERYAPDWEIGGHDRFAAPEEQAVSVAAKRTVRMVFRALDHLPPGEISLADVGRAIVAADVAGGGRAEDRARLASEFVRRGVVSSAAELDTPVNSKVAKLSEDDMAVLQADDGAARAFADMNRTLLGIPAGRAFEVLPRHLLARTGPGGRRRLAFRVRWTNVEDHDLGPTFGSRWVVPAGTTLVLDTSGGGRAVTQLTSEASGAQRLDRAAMLRRWADEGRLVPAAKKGGSTVPDAMIARGGREPQRLSGAGRLLHVMGAQSADGPRAPGPPASGPPSKPGAISRRRRPKA